MSVQVGQPYPDTRNNTQGDVQNAARSHAYDGVDKLRTSSPQALIDTDFEYGVQPTKWESLALQNNRQSMYYDPQLPIPINATTNGITSAGAAIRSLITVSTTQGVSVGQPIYIQDALNSYLNGWYYIESVSAGTSFTYYCAGSVPSGTNYFNPANTYLYVGNFYSGCGINLAATTAFTFSGTTITVTTANAHGLSRGSLIYVTGLTGGTPAPNGAFVVDTAASANTFTYIAIAAPTVAIANTVGNANLFVRPAGYVVTRPFDGGVQFTAGSNVPNAQLIRQTRRYFRYQSGKAIQMSTGSTLKPPIQVASLTSVGTTVTVATVSAHNLAVGTVIQMLGAVQTDYNGRFTIVTTPTPTTLTYTAVTAPSATTATTLTQYRLSPYSWYGSVNRVGIFDLQNGLFFEFDGQTLYAVRRSSTTQIQGTVQVTQGSGLVTGLGTAFSTQLNTRDYIVIRGQSYRVLNIASDTSLFITPEYRGATYSGSAAGGFTVSRTIDTKVPQSQWWDPCDGSGPSGYTLDMTRMQMWYIDYSWYGAGVARFGFRATGGAVTYMYGFQHNNVTFEAYMRSGNLPAHYEVDGLLPTTQIAASFSNSTTAPATMTVVSTAGFPPSGSIRLTQAGGTGAAEVMSYSLKTDTTFVISARAQTGGSASNVDFAYSATAPVNIEYVSPDSAVPLSHWGSSVIMDGRFDDDKSLLFNYGTVTSISVPANATVPILALRIGPSVDSGQVGTLGTKEIVNHMQLQPVELGLVTAATFLIQLTLNGYTTNFTGPFVQPTVGSTSQITSSLAQVAVNTATNATIVGGEAAAGAYTNSTGVTTLDLSQVRDLGNSILGGGTTNIVPTSRANVYPDGPDILYISATNTTGTAASLLARITWKEAQA